MKIIKIQVHNFLGLTAFKSGRLGKLNRITGGNGVGKSSILKAITEAFKSSGVDPDLIHLDSDKAEIYVELDENILIERKITASANNVKVTINDQPVTSPQKFLASLLGGYNFDPTAFFLADAKERRQRLLSAIPFGLTQAEIVPMISAYATREGDIDFSQIDYSNHGLIVLKDMAKLVYDKRHEIGIEVTRQKKSIEQDKIELGDTGVIAEKFKGFDITAAVEELTQRQELKTAREKDEESLEDLRRQSEKKLNEINIKEKELIQLKAERSELIRRGQELKTKIDSAQLPDVDGLQKEVSDFYHSQKVVNRLEDIERREGQLEQSKDNYDALDRLHIALVGDVPRKLLERIKLPIEGLEIEGDNILVKGVALDKLSTSEQMRFAVLIAESLCGDLDTILMDRFESLDEEAKIEFVKIAGREDTKYQYVIAQVTSGPLAMQSEAVDMSIIDMAEKAGRGKVETGKAGF